MNEIKTQRKIKEIMEDYIFDNICKEMTPIDILHVLCKGFDSDKCDLSYKEKYNKEINNGDNANYAFLPPKIGNAVVIIYCQKMKGK